MDGRGSALPDLTSALVPPVTVQLVRDDSSICFESIFDSGAFTTNNAEIRAAKSRFDALQPVPVLPSPGCGQPIARWSAGTSTPDSLVHDSLTRTFRVYVPSLYDAAVPSPVVILLHGGFGSGAQIETSSRMLEVADEHGFIVVSPDGVPSPAGIRTWNAGGCCGYAAGMSNGAELSHRLACDLGDRIRAIGPVAGVDVTTACTPARAVPMLEVHGTADQNVPYDGGLGCGLSGVSTPSVPDTVALRAARNSCTGEPITSLVLGDGRCARQGKCPNGNDVELCVIGGGGHHWPGGVPPSISGIGNCSFGYQSQTFSAPRVLWNFFSAHPSGGALASLENLVTAPIEPQLRRTR